MSNSADPRTPRAEPSPRAASEGRADRETNPAASAVLLRARPDRRQAGDLDRRRSRRGGRRASDRGSQS